MRAIDLKLTDRIYEVISVDTIRTHIVVKISIEDIKGEKGNSVTVISIETNSDMLLYSKPDSSFITSFKYKSTKVFTTLKCAQKHQLRRRKRERLNLLSEFKEARKRYEDYKLNYKNLPASNPE